MDAVVHAALVYLFLFVVFRVAGKRTLSETTPFELVLLLIISETTQQAMVGDDNSLTTAGILILTLVGLDILLSVLKQSFTTLEPLLDGVPVVVARDGELLDDCMRRERVDRDDILEAARNKHGLLRLDQIKLAVLERGGDISIVPKE